jgi:hypothetical protein
MGGNAPYAFINAPHRPMYWLQAQRLSNFSDDQARCVLYIWVCARVSPGAKNAQLFASWNCGFSLVCSHSEQKISFSYLLLGAQKVKSIE